MKKPFQYDMRAVVVAPGKALSLKKIFAASFYLVIGYLLYTVVTYLALLYDGVSFDYIRQSYGFFPLRLFPFDAVAARILHFLGIALAALCLSLGIMAVAAITFEELRGNIFFSSAMAVRMAFRRSPTLIIGYLSLGILVGVIYLLGVVAGLIGRIPLLGDLVIGVFYIIPVFFTLLFTVFVAFVGCIGLVLLPIIIAAQRTRDLFDALLHLFSIVIRQPIRFLWYLAISAGLAKAASFVMAYFFYRTLQFSRLMLVQGGGAKIERMFNAAMDMLPLDSPVVKFVDSLFPGVRFGFSLSRWGYGGEPTLGAFLLAVSFFLLFMVVCGYMISVLATGLARGYVVICRMKDDHSIIDEPPLEPIEDYAGPPIDVTPPSADE
ncbi:MAG: hypothetical protein PHR28_11775 [candidate division Zixibacteria bacterium]|nr:hypothetical protein [candidate division Zixibacteria bacterium]